MIFLELCIGQGRGKQPPVAEEFNLVSCCGVTPTLVLRQTISNLKKRDNGIQKKDPEEKGQHFPL